MGRAAALRAGSHPGAPELELADVFVGEQHLVLRQSEHFRVTGPIEQNPRIVRQQSAGARQMRRHLSVETFLEHVGERGVVPRADEWIALGVRRQLVEEASGKGPVPVRAHGPEDFAVVVDGELMVR